MNTTKTFKVSCNGNIKVINIINKYSDFLSQAASSFSLTKDTLKHAPCCFIDEEGDYVSLANQEDFQICLDTINNTNMQVMNIIFTLENPVTTVETVTETSEETKPKYNQKLKSIIPNKYPISPEHIVLPPSGEIIHCGVMCDGCGQTPITGIRYKCSECANFDYCEKCEEIFSEQHGHSFIELTHPSMAFLLRNKFPAFKGNIGRMRPRNIQRAIPFKARIVSCGGVKKFIGNKPKILNMINPFAEKPIENKFAFKLIHTPEFQTKNNRTFYIAELQVRNTGAMPWPSPLTFACDTKSCIKTEPFKIVGEVPAGKIVVMKLKFDLKEVPVKNEKYLTCWNFYNEKKEKLGEVVNVSLNIVHNSKLNIKNDFVEMRLTANPMTTDQFLKLYNQKKAKKMKKEKIDYLKLLQEMKKEYDFVLETSDSEILNALIETKGDKFEAYQILKECKEE